MRACVGVRMSVEAGMMSFREREGGVSAGGGGGTVYTLFVLFERFYVLICHI